VNGNRFNGLIQCNLAALGQLYVVQSKRTSVQTADWSVGLLDRLPAVTQPPDSMQ
jgi:hypothetical protein